MTSPIFPGRKRKPCRIGLSVGPARAYPFETAQSRRRLAVQDKTKPKFDLLEPAFRYNLWLVAAKSRLSFSGEETILQVLLGLSGLIDRLNRYVGYLAAVLVLLSSLISAGNAASRYLLSISSNAWLEIQWQMFAGIFLLGAPYVLQVNEHVRVDLLYGAASKRAKLWIDVLGIILFLFPATIFIAMMSYPFFWSAYVGGDVSSSAGGLYLWPVKLLLPLGFSLLFLQGVSELIKRIAALLDVGDIVITYEKPLQ